MITRALDRFFRKLQAVVQLLKDNESNSEALRIILRCAKHQTDLRLQFLQQQFKASLLEMRQQIAAPRQISHGDSNQPLAELLAKIEQTCMQNMKSCLVALLQFTSTEWAFHSMNFLVKFGVYVRENLVAAFFKQIVVVGREFIEGKSDRAYVTPTVVLLLARFSLNMETSTVGYMLDQCEQLFRMADYLKENKKASKFQLSKAADLTCEMRAIAQKLLDHFVELEGSTVSQVLQKILSIKST